MITALYIDNDAEMRSIIPNVCERKCPIQMHTVRSGNDALAFLAYRPVDVIVSEVDFPGPSGLDFLKTLQRSRIGIPVIFFTANNSTGSRSEALKNGAFAYISRGGAETNPFGHLIRTMFEAVPSAHQRAHPPK
jgi:two-component system response regulator AtoC